MKKRTLKEWRRLVSEYELGQEDWRGFCVRHGLATSTLDYSRHRGRIECKWRLLRGADEWSILFANGSMEGRGDVLAVKMEGKKS
jgi:hypothetical protein